MLNNNLCISCAANVKTFGEYIYSTETSYFRKILRDDRLYSCIKCGLIQANHSIIKLDKLDNYYKNVYQRTKPEIPSNSKPFWKWKGRGIVFCWIINDYVKNNEKPLYIYELGSGDGLNITELKVVFPNARIFSDPFNSDKFNQEIEREELKERKYDIVLLSHVLEHLLDPLKWINDISYSLKKEGLLIIEVPNDNDFFMSRLFRKRINECDEPHISFFNSQSLLELFQKFRGQLLIKELYTSGGVYDNTKSLSIVGAIKRYIKKFPNKSDIFKYIYPSRKSNKTIQVSIKKIKKLDTTEKLHNFNQNTYPKYPTEKLISWFTKYLQDISRKIECNPDPQKEGPLLRIILQKIV